MLNPEIIIFFNLRKVFILAVFLILLKNDTQVKGR